MLHAHAKQDFNLVQNILHFLLLVLKGVTGNMCIFFMGLMQMEEDGV